MKLSVIICTSGREKALKKCLESLRKQSNPNFEVVIVRKGGGDLGGKQKLRIKFVKDPGEGLAKARDLGWRAASGKHVAWIDDDVVVHKDWVQKVIERLEKDPNVGGVSGPCLVPERLLTNRRVFFWYKPRGLGQKLLSFLWVKVVLAGKPYEVGRIYPWGWWSPGANFKESLKIKGLVEVDYLEACNMTLRRELVEKVGGFDLGYRGTSEWCEVDLARRVKRLGKRLVFSCDVRVRHEVSQEGVYSQRQNYLERGRNWVRFMRGSNE